MFSPRVTPDGVAHSISEGMVGLGAQNAKAWIDNVSVQRLRPATTFVQTEEFTTAPVWFNESTQGWSLSGGRFAGQANGSPAVSLSSLSVGSAYLIELSSKFSTTGEGGLVFDFYSPTDYKFLTVSQGKITLGHRTSSGIKVDAVHNNSNIALNADETLGLTLKGTTVSVTRKVGTATSNIMSFVYNAVVTDGSFGMLSAAGTTSFDSTTIKSDDPGLSGAVPALSVERSRAGGSSSELLAAAGFDLSGEDLRAAFPEFSLVGFDQEGDDAELEAVGEVEWYVEA